MDAHWCNALELIIKSFVLDLDEMLEDAFASLLLEHQAQKHSATEVVETVPAPATAAAPPAPCCTCEQIEKYLDGGEFGRGRVVRTTNDDKAKTPCGEPKHAVSTGVRPSAPCPAHILSKMVALDHDWHRCSLTPTSTLISTIPDELSGSWRHGCLTVTVKDLSSNLHLHSNLHLRNRGRARGRGRGRRKRHRIGETSRSDDGGDESDCSLTVVCCTGCRKKLQEYSSTVGISCDECGKANSTIFGCPDDCGYDMCKKCWDIQ